MSETIHTSHVEQPGKHEFKEEVRKETDGGVRYETHYYKTEPHPEVADPYSRAARGHAIIQRNVMWALGAGVLPIPLFDFVAITAVQVKLLKELSDLYGLPFSSSIAKKIIYSLLSGLGSVGVGGAVGSSLAKLIPGIGSTLGAVSVPIIAGAATNAVGKMFLMHFESGGTILDFDPNAMRAHFKQEFERSKEAVSRLRREEARATVPRPL